VRLHVKLPLPLPFAFGHTSLLVVWGSSPSGVLPLYLVHRIIMLDAAMAISNDQARALCIGASAVFLLLVLVSSRTLDLIGPIALPFALAGSIMLPFALAASGLSSLPSPMRSRSP
jgi:hypothetical protein